VSVFYTVSAAFFLIILISKLFAQSKTIDKQQAKITMLKKTLRSWQKTHSKCIDSVCVDKVLDDIILNSC